jgi:DNA-binding NarL/FixJ family response regulator
MAVAVVEDDAACREGLALAIGSAPDMRLAWVAATHAQALARLPGAPLDVLLVDLGLPDGSGLDVIAHARRHWPACAPMVCTIFGDEAHVLAAIQAGAMGYLLKDATPETVVQEVRSLHAGGSPINPLVARKLLLHARLADAPPPGVGTAAPAPTACRRCRRARWRCCAWCRADTRWWRWRRRWTCRSTPRAPSCGASTPSCRSSRARRRCGRRRGKGCSMRLDVL